MSKQPIKNLPITEALHWELKAASAQSKQSLRDYVEAALWKHLGKTPPLKIAA